MDPSHCWRCAAGQGLFADSSTSSGQRAGGVSFGKNFVDPSSNLKSRPSGNCSEDIGWGRVAVIPPDCCPSGKTCLPSGRHKNQSIVGKLRPASLVALAPCSFAVGRRPQWGQAHHPVHRASKAMPISVAQACLEPRRSRQSVVHVDSFPGNGLCDNRVRFRGKQGYGRGAEYRCSQTPRLLLCRRHLRRSLCLIARPQPGDGRQSPPSRLGKACRNTPQWSPNHPHGRVDQGRTLSLRARGSAR